MQETIEVNTNVIKPIIQKKETELPKQLYRFYYKLMKPARLRKCNKDGKCVIWNVPRYSSKKNVVAYDMPIACLKIRKKLKGDWIGFRIIDVKETTNL